MLFLIACSGLSTVPGADKLTDSTDSGPQSGDLQVRPESMDFGDIAVGDHYAREVTLSNTGERPLSIQMTMNGDDGFSTTNTQISLEGESIISVDFAPDHDGNYATTLQVDAGTRGYAEVALTGTSGGGGQTDDSGGGGTTTAPGPDISVDPGSYNFGQVDVSANANYTFLVENNGTSTLNVSELRFSDSAFSHIGGSLNPPQDIEPGKNKTITVGFSPSRAQNYNADMTVVSNDGDSPNLRVSLSGEGADLCNICSPILTADTGGSDPYGLDFYLITAIFGNSTSQDVTISNDGDQDLIVGNVTVTNDIFSTCGTYSISGWGASQTLAPGRTANFTVNWRVASTPCADLDQTTFNQNIIEITSNDPASPYVIVVTGAAI